MYSQDVKYFVSINGMPIDGKLPSGDPRWSRFTNSFENCELSQYDILSAILDGRSYCCWLNGGRKKENFTLGQHIALDFDTEDANSEIDTLMANPMIRAYASIIHTTPSHTPQSPRARVIFLLDNPVIEVAKYESMIQFMIDMFQTDQSCSDATRFFYGSKNAEVAFPAHELPISHLRELYRRYSGRYSTTGANTPQAHENAHSGRGSRILRLSDYRERKQYSDESAKSIIEAFDQAHRVDDSLRRYGYTMQTTRRWVRPDGKSASVFVDHANNKSIHHSSSDPLYRKVGGVLQPAGPFDYYQAYECGGNIGQAIESLEKLTKVA